MTGRFSDQDIASMEGPRILKDPGSVEWSWQTVSALQHMWQSLHLNYAHYMTILSEAEEYRIWEIIPPDTPYGTKENMLQHVEIGDSKDAQKRMKVQTLAAQATALQRVGANQHEVGGATGHPLLKKGSHNSDYLLARIARDRPDILERVKAGEFDSVRAAAREAGIIAMRPKKTVTLSDDVARVADVLRSHYGSEQLRQIVERLSHNSD